MNLEPTLHRQLGHADHVPGTAKFPLAFMLDGVGDALNIGSSFRLADALGAERLYLAGDVPTPPNRHISKTARNTDTVVPWESNANIRDAIDAAKKAGYQIVCVELTDKSIPVNTFVPASQAVCLVVGAENKGVSQEALGDSDAVVHIPMRGQNSSMNVITALAIAAYQITIHLNKNES